MNSRTRIKHMEGYFRNASPPPSPPTGTIPHSTDKLSFGKDGTPPARRFTRQQREQLEQQYHDYERMDALHEARIKVLRDRQEKRLREVVTRMEQELESMREVYIENIAGLQAEQRREESSLIEALEGKKFEMRRRWLLEEAILRHQLELQNGLVYGSLPPVSFSVTDSEIHDSAIFVSESFPIASDSQA